MTWFVAGVDKNADKEVCLDMPRNYWITSPNVDGSGKCVEQWKNEIRRRHVTIMGWDPNVVSNKMGSRFACIGHPSIQIGDVVLIGRSRTRREMVAVGIVDSEYWPERLEPHPQNDLVYLRRLEPFVLLEEVPERLPLDRVLPHSKAMTERPLSLDNRDHRQVIDWVDGILGESHARLTGQGRHGGFPRQPDIEHRHAVENAAQEAVTEFYTRQHYRVDDVSANRSGWDLLAEIGQVRLKIEVKGLSGTVAHAELTPNEYRLMKDEDSSYRLCIVTSALEASRRIQEFRFDSARRVWVDQHGKRLTVTEKPGAKVEG